MTMTNALEALRGPPARWLLLCLMVVCSSMACAPQPKLAGPTAPSGYFFVMRAPDIKTERLPASAELTVRVQDAQGQPVDGVPVQFQVAPTGERIGSVSPERAMTNSGTARGVFQAQSAGRAPVRVRVENTTQEAVITVTVEDDPD
jgi:Big-like domain-containing protein